MLGSPGAGKSSLTVRFIQGHFIDEYDPTIEDSYRKQIVVDGEIVLTEILDTAGGEDLSFKRGYVTAAHGFMMTYSITSSESFAEVKKFHDDVLKIREGVTCAFLLVGNKSDLAEGRVVSTEEGEALAREWGCPFMETSAKTGQNCDAAYIQLLRSAFLLSPSSSHSKPKNTCNIL